MSKDDSTGKIQWDRLIKLSPYTVQKGLRYLKHYGLKEFWIRLHERLNRKRFLTDHGMRHTDLTRKHWRSSGNANFRMGR